jgi:hypothetical protein
MLRNELAVERDRRQWSAGVTFTFLTFRKTIGLSLMLMALAVAPMSTQAQEDIPPRVEDFSESALVVSAAKYLGATAESMAEIMNNVFSRYGEPTAVVRGEEVSAAVMFGLRYGRGTIKFLDGSEEALFWRGPSAGIDTGGNASKMFALVYGVHQGEDLHMRIGGADGSAFYIGGVSASYLQRNEIVVVPMRAGVGLRAGVSVGYLKFAPSSGWFPF